MYTVVDIETTGNGIYGNRITEIALFNIDQGRIADSYSTLVNPGCEIPAFITGLTGITTAMVRNAPDFSEIAPKIDAFSSGRVFVAHSVNFDYPIVRKEFERCGLDFGRKKLCTVRLSRRVFPGLRSYSLGKLCRSLEIPLSDRHRAAGDARATALLLLRAMEQPGGQDTIAGFLNARSREGTLPPHLPLESFRQLPEAPGIYFFKDSKGNVIYVGKAIDIRQRALGHFYDTSDRERRLCRETSQIDFELSGSDLVALLMEAAAIKKYFPKYNRAQKNIRPAFGLFSYPDRNGVIHLAFNRLARGQQALRVFFSQTDARLFLEQLCTEFGLCAKFCHLQEGVATCSHFRVPQCAGICSGKQTVEAYNKKVRDALQSLEPGGNHLVIDEQGRQPDERGLVWVADGTYRGYGFVPKGQCPDRLPDLEALITPQKHYPETEKIVQSYILKHPARVKRIPG